MFPILFIYSGREYMEHTCKIEKYVISLWCKYTTIKNFNEYVYLFNLCWVHVFRFSLRHRKSDGDSVQLKSSISLKRACSHA